MMCSTNYEAEELDIRRLQDPTRFISYEEAISFKRFLEDDTGVRFMISYQGDGFRVEPAAIRDADGMSVEIGDILYDRIDEQYTVSDIRYERYSNYTIFLKDEKSKINQVSNQSLNAEFRHAPWTFTEKRSYAKKISRQHKSEQTTKTVVKGKSALSNLGKGIGKVASYFWDSLSDYVEDHMIGVLRGMFLLVFLAMAFIFIYFKWSDIYDAFVQIGRLQLSFNG